MFSLFRIGFGYDAHRLVEGRPLILGGISIPFAKGLLGHSDADVLTHAVIDAILGALAMGDIGRHFPDTDPAFKDMQSLRMLEQVIRWVPGSRIPGQQRGFNDRGAETQTGTPYSGYPSAALGDSPGADPSNQREGQDVGGDGFLRP